MHAYNEIFYNNKYDEFLLYQNNLGRYFLDGARVQGNENGKPSKTLYMFQNIEACLWFEW